MPWLVSVTFFVSHRYSPLGVICNFWVKPVSYRESYYTTLLWLECSVHIPYLLHFCWVPMSSTVDHYFAWLRLIHWGSSRTALIWKLTMSCSQYRSECKTFTLMHRFHCCLEIYQFPDFPVSLIDYNFQRRTGVSLQPPVSFPTFRHCVPFPSQLLLVCLLSS